MEVAKGKASARTDLLGGLTGDVVFRVHQNAHFLHQSSLNGVIGGQIFSSLTCARHLVGRRGVAGALKAEEGLKRKLRLVRGLGPVLPWIAL